MISIGAVEELYRLVVTAEDGLHSDIELCKTREEHIRLTARANEVGKVRDGLQQLIVKLSTTTVTDK
jgi:hypothetical protein